MTSIGQRLQEQEQQERSRAQREQREALVRCWQAAAAAADAEELDDDQLDQLREDLHQAGLSPSSFDGMVGDLRRLRDLRGEGDVEGARQRAAEIRREQGEIEQRIRSLRVELVQLQEKATALNQSAVEIVQRAVEAKTEHDRLVIELRQQGADVLEEVGEAPEVEPVSAANPAAAFLGAISGAAPAPRPKATAEGFQRSIGG